jgi:hypothetical protein
VVERAESRGKKITTNETELREALEVEDYWIIRARVSYRDSLSVEGAVELTTEFIIDKSNLERNEVENITRES